MKEDVKALQDSINKLYLILPSALLALLIYWTTKETKLKTVKYKVIQGYIKEAFYKSSCKMLFFKFFFLGGFRFLHIP